MGSSSKPSSSRDKKKKKKHSKKKDSKKHRHHHHHHHHHEKEHNKKGKDKNKDKGSISKKEDNEHAVENRITVDDYYSKNAEFRIWLNNSKGIHYSDCKEPRKYFEKFVKAWNRGKLDKMIYQGHIPAELRVASMSKFSWGFENKLNDQEQMDISALAERVDRETDSAILNQSKGLPRARPAGSESSLKIAQGMEAENKKRRKLNPE